MYEKQKRRRTIVCGERYRLPDIKLRVDNIFFIYIILTCAEERRRRGISRDKGKEKKEGGYMKRAANKTGGSSGGGGFMAADFESSSSLFSDLPGPPKTTVACFLYPLVEDDSLDLQGKSQKKSASCRCGCDQKSKLWDLFDPWHQTHFAATLGFLFPFLFFCKSRRQICFVVHTFRELVGKKKRKLLYSAFCTRCIGEFIKLYVRVALRRCERDPAVFCLFRYKRKELIHPLGWL